MGACLVPALLVTLGVVGNFTNIKDTGNSAASNGKGAVDYEYEISVGELTNGEYVQFLNCVASNSDVHGLYSPTMGQHFLGGIIREENNDGTYSYHVKDGYDKLPVNGLSWLSAARYCNWLHYNSELIANGAPLSEFLPYTEGSLSMGVYNTIAQDPTTITRNADARYWIPNGDEWYKAAYFNGKNWKTDTVYENANVYNPQTGWSVKYPHLRSVDEDTVFSHYGTVAQQGNVAEWVEDRNNGTRMSLGGSVIRPVDYCRFNRNEGDYADKGVISFGVRLCRKPINSYSVKINNDLVVLQELESVSYNDEKSIIEGRNGGEYVKVGDADNPGDIVNRFKGSVGYEYGIMRGELSNQEYCRFLNAVANVTDKYGLYDENMGTGVIGGIDRIKRGNGFKYVVKDGYCNRPVTYIGFYELARYANWLHFGCPEGEQIVGITEGTKTTGAYDTSDFEAVRSGAKKIYRDFGKRNMGALYWIPNENEWYKAAYYDPTIFGHRKYHDYPTRTSMPPTSSEANYMIDNELAVGAPFFVAEVDDYEGSASYYGTLNQGGNVWEWTESWQYGNVGQRALRGGSWQYTQQGLNAENEDPGGINDKSYLFGGRICCALDSAGYKPVDIAFSQKLYQWVVTRPKKHIFVGFIVLCAFAVFGLFFCVKPIVKMAYKCGLKVLKKE